MVLIQPGRGGQATPKPACPRRPPGAPSCARGCWSLRKGGGGRPGRGEPLAPQASAPPPSRYRGSPPGPGARPPALLSIGRPPPRDCPFYPARSSRPRGLPGVPGRTDKPLCRSRPRTLLEALPPRAPLPASPPCAPSSALPPGPGRGPQPACQTPRPELCLGGPPPEGRCHLEVLAATPAPKGTQDGWTLPTGEANPFLSAFWAENCCLSRNSPSPKHPEDPEDGASASTPHDRGRGRQRLLCASSPGPRPGEQGAGVGSPSCLLVMPGPGAIAFDPQGAAAPLALVPREGEPAQRQPGPRVCGRPAVPLNPPSRAVTPWGRGPSRGGTATGMPLHAGPTHDTRATAAPAQRGRPALQVLSKVEHLFVGTAVSPEDAGWDRTAGGGGGIGLRAGQLGDQDSWGRAGAQIRCPQPGCPPAPPPGSPTWTPDRGDSAGGSGSGHGNFQESSQETRPQPSSQCGTLSGPRGATPGSWGSTARRAGADGAPRPPSPAASAALLPAGGQSKCTGGEETPLLEPGAVNPGNRILNGTPSPPAPWQSSARATAAHPRLVSPGPVPSGPCPSPVTPVLWAFGLSLLQESLLLAKPIVTA
ncbi:translation initiation factor IF-2-like [Choloepus didactylus]|uniref:translation initiation factor IF-2-like n=1 Tax=Choloepus didactylus TaxID=27675 RepID=UPI00189DD0DA|nr:translation initiation factor IF-2-like [Choloepus didactylus]